MCLFACGHSTCLECGRRLASLALEEGVAGLGRLRCPSCSAFLEASDLKQLLSEEQFARWDAMALERALGALEGAQRCPRCDAVATEDAEGCAACPSCRFVFCSLCLDRWHPPSVPCESALDRLEALRLRAGGADAAQLAKARAAAEDALSRRAVEALAKRCPGCGVPVHRTDGCNKMTCAVCSTFFCYRCGKKIDGYDHFGDKSCRLFDADVIQRWEDEIRERERRAAWGGADENEQRALWRQLAGGGQGQGRGQGGGIRLPPSAFSTCPRCHRRLLREGGTNHVKCGACQTAHCAACGTILRKGEAATHFRPSGCKQHQPWR